MRAALPNTTLNPGSAASSRAAVLGNLKAGLREAEVLELPPGAAISQVTFGVPDSPRTLLCIFAPFVHELQQQAPVDLHTTRA